MITTHQTKTEPRSITYAISALELRMSGRTDLADKLTILSQEAFEWERYNNHAVANKLK